MSEVTNNSCRIAVKDHVEEVDVCGRGAEKISLQGGARRIDMVIVMLLVLAS